MSKTTTFRVTFSDDFYAETEEQCYDKLIDYLYECVINKDVTAFGFQKVYP